MKTHNVLRSITLVVALISLLAVAQGHDDQAGQGSQPMLDEGRRIFRYDTFGDEAYWGDTLQLHKAIEGERFGGVGPGVSPRTALAVGLKVDVDALPPALQNQLRHGRVNLDDPATTLALLKLNARSVIPPWMMRSHQGLGIASTGGRTAT